MDAINHLPEILTRWESFEEQTMLLHFATYDDKWGGADDTFTEADVFGFDEVWSGLLIRLTRANSRPASPFHRRGGSDPRRWFSLGSSGSDG